MPGGPRRRAARPLCSQSVHEVLTQYVSQDSQPFQFSKYNHLQLTQAASGVGLLRCSAFLRLWLSSHPDCQLSHKQFVSVLGGILQAGSLSRFPPGHLIWEHVNLQQEKQKEWWCAKQAAKLTVIFNHLRRIKSNSTKWTQAVRGMSQKGQEELKGIVDMVVLPESNSKKRKMSAHGGSLSSSNFRPLQDSTPQKHAKSNGWPYPITLSTWLKILSEKKSPFWNLEVLKIGFYIWLFRSNIAMLSLLDLPFDVI